MPLKQVGTPDWAKWRLIPNPMVWEAVAPSLNIDPDNRLQLSEYEWKAGWQTGGIQLHEDRLRMACANYQEIMGEHSGTIRIGDRHKASVSLLKFVRWALLHNWHLPSELSAIATSPNADTEIRARSSGFSAADRVHFEEITRMMHDGRARSAFGAALVLAKDGKLAGHGTMEALAKRVSGRFLREFVTKQGTETPGLKTTPNN